MLLYIHACIHFNQGANRCPTTGASPVVPMAPTHAPTAGTSSGKQGPIKPRQELPCPALVCPHKHTLPRHEQVHFIRGTSGISCHRLIITMTKLASQHHRICHVVMEETTLATRWSKGAAARRPGQSMSSGSYTHGSDCHTPRQCGGVILHNGLQESGQVNEMVL